MVNQTSSDSAQKTSTFSSQNEERVQPLSIQKLDTNKVFRYISDQLADDRIFESLKGRFSNLEEIKENPKQRELDELTKIIVEIYNTTAASNKNQKKRALENDSTSITPSKRRSLESNNNNDVQDGLPSKADLLSDPTDPMEVDQDAKTDVESVKTTSEKGEDLSSEESETKHGDYYLVQDHFKSPISEYKITAAAHTINMTTRLTKLFQTHAETILPSKSGSSYILFFSHQERKEIFALTSGSSYKIVSRVVDYKFPKRALCLLDSKKIIEISQKSLLSPYIETTMRHQNGFDFYTTQSLHQWVKSLTCQVKSSSTLGKLARFQPPKSSPPNLTIKLGLIRIQRDLDFNAYPEVLEQLSKMSSGETGEICDPFFELLSIPQITKGDRFVKKLLALLYSATSTNLSQIGYFNPPKDQEKFRNAETWTIQIGKENKPINSPTLDAVIQGVKELASPKNKEQFIEAFEKGKIKFDSCTYSLLECLNGEIVMDDKPYFRVENKWFYLKADHHALLQEDFQRFLSKSLMSPEDSKKLLPLPWAGNTAPNPLNEENVQKQFNLDKEAAKKLVDEIKHTKVSYIQLFEVKYKLLQGDILDNPLIEKYQSTINELLSSQEPFSKDVWKNRIGNDKETERILRELSYPRYVVEYDKIVNPFPELFINHEFLNRYKCYDKFKEFITDSNKKEFTETELKKALKLKKATGIRAFISDLKNTSFSYIQQAKINQKTLIGEILNNPLIQKRQIEIEKFLTEYQNPTVQDFEGIFKTDAQKIIEELTLERKIVNSRNYVINPLVYPFANRKDIPKENLQKFLEEACEASEKAESEENYNRSYLHTNFNKDKGSAFYEKNHLRLVFDQICPFNVEIADVIYYNKSHDPDRTYLCVIKEKFGQDTRVACAQAVDAAKVLSSALHLHQVHNTLDQLWERGTNLSSVEKKDISFREALKGQLEHIGKERFLKIFRKKIVFVYAFLKKKKSFQAEMKNITRWKSKDFDSLKIDSKRIYQGLKDKGFLDSHGRLTGKFYGFSVKEKFLDELKEFKDCRLPEVYDLLLKHKTISKSTLAKLELLRAAKEIENLGFEFKICEIERKTGLGYADGNEEETLSLESSSSTFSGFDLSSLDTSQKEFPHLIRGKRYNICKTVGDGGCALHALLGDLVKDTYTCDIQNYRKKFANRVKESISNFQKTKDPQFFEIWKIYKDIFELFLGDFTKIENGGTENNLQNAKTFFGSDALIQKGAKECIGACHIKMNKIKDLQKERFDNLKKFFEKNCPKDSEGEKEKQLIEILKKSHAQYAAYNDLQFKEKMYQSPELLKNAFESSLDEIMKIFDEAKLIIENYAYEIGKVEKEREDLLKDFISQDVVIKRYCSVLSDNSYYLNDCELALAAWIFDKHLLLVAENSYPSENEEYKNEFNNNGTEPIVIFHRGLHYERCMPVPTTSTQSSLSTTFSTSSSQSTQLMSSAPNCK